MAFHFRSDEKLKNNHLIDYVFENGKKYHHYPFLFLFASHDNSHTIDPSGKKHAPVQIGFVVSKKRFKRAVDRNRIKRMMREAYRLQKNKLYQIHHDAKGHPLAIMMIYIGNKIPQYSVIFDAVTQFITHYEHTVR